jgi:glycosyltransferase involved in cell wall biosynthesis
MPILALFEDSSKVRFGGGQEMSLLLIRELRKTHDLRLFDFARNSLFLEQARALGAQPRRLLGYGRVTHDHRQSFSCGWLELILLPFFLPINVIHGFFALRSPSDETPILLAATRKCLLLAGLLSFVMKVKLVYYAHSIDDEGLLARLFRRRLRRCNLVLAISKTVADALPVPAVILPGAADAPVGMSIPHNLPRDRKIRVVVFAALQRWKGIDIFLRSLTLLHHGDRVAYRIYGEGPRRQELERLAGDDARVRFFGHVDFAEVCSEVDLIVLPSIAPEAFGLNLVKAAACGIPVVATNLGAHAELVRDGITGLLVPPGDPAALAVAIDRLLDDPAEYQQMSAAAAEWAREYDVAHFQERLAAAIKQLG